MHDSSMVFSWGPPRMGTTWLFNVLQEIASESGIEFGIVADGLPLPRNSWKGPVLLKSHRADFPELIAEFDQKVGLFACVIVRNVESTLKSLVRTQKANVDELLTWLETDLVAYSTTLPCMTRVAVIEEEWIARQGVAVIRRLAMFLNVPLTTDQCERIDRDFSRASVKAKIDKLENGNNWKGEFKNYDPASQWHAGHISLEESPNLELTKQQHDKVDTLQISVDALVSRYSLWETQESTIESNMVNVPAVDFIRARQQVIDESAVGGPSSTSRFKNLFTRMVR